MRFSDSIQYDIPKLNKYATYDSSPFNSDDPLSEDTFSQEDLFSSQHNPLPTPTLQENSSSNDSIKKLSNLILRTEHNILLKMTSQSIIIPLTNKQRPIIVRDYNHEKIIDNATI